jgi:hypothetical protein
MNGWFPFFVIATAPKARQGRLAETLLPAIVPVAATHRVAIATLAADNQIRSAERREANVASEAVSAVQAVAAKADPARALTDDELSTRPSLSAVVKRVPDIRQRIDAAGLAIANQFEAKLAEESVKMIEAIYTAQPVATRVILSHDQLKTASSALYGLLQRGDFLSRIGP